MLEFIRDNTDIPNPNLENCYYQIDFRLKINVENSKEFEMRVINEILLSDLPNFLREEHGIIAYVRIDKISEGSIIVYFSILIAILTVISGIKDLYEIISIIIDFIHRHFGNHASITHSKITGGYPIKKYPTRILGKEILFLQIITLILIVFLIGIYLGKAF